MRIPNSKSEYGISRTEDTRSRTKGWQVAVQRKGKKVRKLFSDSAYGGEAGALHAAQVFRNLFLKENPPLDSAAFAGIKKSHNRSGVVGVSRTIDPETRFLPEMDQKWYWCASWPTDEGPRGRIKFSIAKWGDDKAFELACKAREEGMKKRTGQFVLGMKNKKFVEIIA